MMIKPASELRNNFTGISNIVREGEIVFLTRNGSGDMVVMSQGKYDEIIALNELYEQLALGEADIRAGRVHTTEEVDGGIQKILERYS